MPQLSSIVRVQVGVGRLSSEASPCCHAYARGVLLLLLFGGEDSSLGKSRMETLLTEPEQRVSSEQLSPAKVLLYLPVRSVFVQGGGYGQVSSFKGGFFLKEAFVDAPGLNQQVKLSIRAPNWPASNRQEQIKSLLNQKAPGGHTKERYPEAYSRCETTRIGFGVTFLCWNVTPKPESPKVVKELPP
eukprot:5109270-Amphidinium_carterae.1